ncbi:MAG: NUDIX domain-containing protein [Pontimonas sp.]|nr:NUDIX domain-containing protein [Pontimonas sp.]
MFDVAVTYILRDNAGVAEVLLGEKLRGLGAGHIVGPGGKVEAGENPEEAAIREVYEEVGLVIEPGNLTPLACISYPFVNREGLSQRSFVFAARVFSGELQSSGELVASWWPVQAIPYERMWSDAKLWLPRALSGEFIDAKIVIGENNEVLSHDC